jgi:hypothetical protein
LVVVCFVQVMQADHEGELTLLDKEGHAMARIQIQQLRSAPIAQTGE